MARTFISIKEGQLMIHGKPIRNQNYLLQYFKKNKIELPNGRTEVGICPLHYVPDGEYVFIACFELHSPTPSGNCHCGVPLDVHGACCEWRNAKHIIDEHLRISDDRHPYYNKNINEWINYGDWGFVAAPQGRALCF